VTAKKTARKASQAAPAAPGRPEGPVCMVDGCDRPAAVRGLCREHWENPQREDA
jgi:hypothetical protein